MLAEAYAKKIAARADGTAKMQTYPSNSGGDGGSVSLHRAKLEARIAAFNAGRKPDASGFLDTDLSPKAETKAPVDEKPKADVKARG